MKAALHNLGCKVNAYETEAMQQILEEAGYEIVPFSEYADVYVINTCSVTNMADRKSRQMLHRAKKQNPDAIVVGAGCYVQTKEAQALVDESIDIVIGNNKKHELVPLLREYEASHRKMACVADINHEKQAYEELSLSRTAEHTRAFIKVQDGCNQFCTYCIIPFARGRVRSRELPDVLQEIRTLAKIGYREVVLTGIHLSSYGVDNGESLLHLIEAVHELEGIERIRLGSLEPRIVTDAFAKRLSELPKICPHFHLSLQSGCDTVLSRMNRRYDTAEYEVGCALLRRYFEHPAITTDVIVGFPGETDEEFETTERYLERIHFYEMHIFQYSRREGTKAAAMPDQVPEAVKKERSEKLLALGHRMSGEFRRYYLGRQVTALLEEEFLYDGKRYYTGYTKEYVKVAVETKKDLSNTFVTGTLKTQLTEDVYLLVEF
ncbi:tRNA (N(6)-L-threonylcarbamoyladenosine(37)-C(2))-methylthiotransferase MtaB [Roseburia hominis]|jgi:threonylcarbamoyladenosine tRNA methylthiotransferase MtaB|uniref:tRNA (N(6)-L-threonylcarbamoyladenosine(37)-C(2))- methylthiotransferase MtaB n=1 Tax=Roseburia hominis TaxID=301301 RepID=UPI0026733E26|nr:tRNA (N(6)-L-threonylcarbamoyladenosine(37)-C(2))-methylthiotransferase MtaB [Roseburia hominis]